MVGVSIEDLAKHVKQQRLAKGLDQGGLQPLGGPSRDVVRKIEKQEWSATTGVSTLAKIDVALGWPQGTAFKLLEEGGDPPMSSEESLALAAQQISQAAERLTEVAERLERVADAMGSGRQSPAPDS